MADPVPCCCLVPAEAAPLVIGRGGAVVRQICQDTGADVNVSGEHDTPPALSDRIVTIWGTAEQKEAACNEVIRIIHRSQDLEEASEGIFVVVVPTSSAEFIIGPKGSGIIGLVERTGAEVNISRHSIAGTDLQPISIMGDVKQTLAASMELVSVVQELADEGHLGDELRSFLERGRPRARSVSRAPSTSGIASGAASRSSTPTKVANNSSLGTSPTPTTRRASAAHDGATASKRPPIRASSRADPGDGVASVLFVVSAPVAAWVVGRGGRTVAEIRSCSGANVEVSRSGGASRLVEVRGTAAAREAAVELLLDTMQELPAGAPLETRLLVPPGAGAGFATSSAAAVCEIAEATGAELEVETLGAAGADGTGAGAGCQLVIISGEPEAARRAALETAAVLGEAASAAPAVTSLPAPAAPAAVRSAAPRPRMAREVHSLPDAWSTSQDSCPHCGDIYAPDSVFCRKCGQKREQAAETPAARGRSGRSPSPVRAASARASSLGPSRAQAAVPAAEGEARLLKALLSGPEPQLARLELLLPAEFVRGVLEAAGQMQAVATRSGCHLEVVAGHAVPPEDVRLVSVRGNMLGNSMAVLYIQELLLQFQHR